jgi:hypothetical protein
MKSILLYVGPLVNLLSVVPYIIDIIRHKTKPNVVSWVTWTVLTGIGTAAVIAEESFVSSLLPLSSTLCTFLVVLLGIKFGFAKYSRADGICQAAAVFGLLLWWIFNSPLIALVAVIVVDAVAAIPTLVHSWRLPNEETWQTFGLASFGSLLTLIAIESYTAGNLAYPIYLLSANALITGTILYGRHRQRLAHSHR